MQNFQFHHPTSLAEAEKALASGDGAKLLAGGQSLLPVMKLDLAEPTDLISVRALAELRGVRVDGERLIIGAATTHAEVARSSEVQQAIAGIADLAGKIGDPQVRNRGTLGGSVAHNDPAADYPAALLALGATVVTQKRAIAAEDFFLGMFETPLEDTEIIKEVAFPIPRACRYEKFEDPASRYALVGIMVARFDDGVRVAITGAGPGVFRHQGLEQALSADFSAEAVDSVRVDEGELNDDASASAAYRAHLIGVMCKRAVAACG